MTHLSQESLARLVDERPCAAEDEHLAQCAACADELQAMREQTAALAALPAPALPGRIWREVERKRQRPVPSAFSGTAVRVMTRIAAAMLIFVAGAMVGSAAGGGAQTAAGPFDGGPRTMENREVTPLSMEDVGADPITRIVALEAIVATTRAALAESPGDPVINGYHLSARQARDATIRTLDGAATAGYADDGWF